MSAFVQIKLWCFVVVQPNGKVYKLYQTSDYTSLYLTSEVISLNLGGSSYLVARLHASRLGNVAKGALPKDKVNIHNRRKFVIFTVIQIRKIIHPFIFQMSEPSRNRYCEAGHGSSGDFQIGRRESRVKQCIRRFYRWYGSRWGRGTAQAPAVPALHGVQSTTNYLKTLKETTDGTTFTSLCAAKGNLSA